MNPLPHLHCLCAEWGAFHVVNHGMSSQILEEMKEAGLRFFHSPEEAKIPYVCDPGSTTMEGYESRMLSKEEGVLDWRDYFDHHTSSGCRRNPSRWPNFQRVIDGKVIRMYVLHSWKTRKILIEKIAQLNFAIDDVSSQLRADDEPNGAVVASDKIEASSI